MIDKTYKGFDLISVNEIPDCASKGIYLRHRKTGLEVFHLLNNDEENLFAFAFRTPLKDSTGAAHITEHSVFCGSEKFPLKEPFTNMMNQSVNTFLNALTYSDKTVYPASSMVKSDYYNLMDVYGDAVFFPLLKKEAFLQEAHRLEIDENGKYSIQGVVYNEMKGNYSSYESVAADAQIHSLYPDTNYSFDSGGDPLVIPEFTYEQFRAFHEKYYRPDNCLVFLYGNIPTEEQLDYLQSHFLNRLEQKYPEPAASEVYPVVSAEFSAMETPAPYAKPVYVVETAPDSGASGATVTINWLCGETKDINSYIESCFLSEILCGHDGSPMTKALIESGLGDDMAPLSGSSNETRFFSMSFGLHGVKPSKAKKVFALIEKTLSDICEEGVDKRDIEAALMSAEFANREVIRSGGPFSLVYLDRALAGWNYGRTPAEMLYFRAALEEVRRNIAADDKYIEKLIRRFLLENKARSYVVVKPSKSFLKQRNKKEKQLLKRLQKTVSAETVEEELKLMHAYQEHHETEKECSCIPCLDINDLKADVDEVVTEIKTVEGDVGKIPVFANTENTNGIVYLELCVPVDCLPAEAYKMLPLYSYCVSNLGWNGKDYVECAALTAVKTGGITCRLVTNQCVNTEESENLKKLLSEYNCVERDWIVFGLRCLSENLDEAVQLFEECVSTYEFKDLKHLKVLAGEARAAINSGVIPHGNRYAAKRVQAAANHSCVVDEIWRGLTQVFALNELCNMDPEKLAKIFEGYGPVLNSAGCLIHINTDKETMPVAMARIETMAANLKLKKPEPKKELDEKAFLKEILLGSEKDCLPEAETFTASCQVGYASSTFKGAFFGDVSNSKEIILAHWLSGGSLWEKIRTKGGAYGAYAGSANMLGLFTFGTYRDPSPWKSVETFDECLKEASEVVLSEEELSRLITGTYGEEVQPSSPYGRGNIGFNRTLSCVTQKDRIKKLENLLNSTPEEIQAAAKRILDSKTEKRTVVICDKSQKNCGVIIDLPL